jgi:hypothetical protein
VKVTPWMLLAKAALPWAAAALLSAALLPGCVQDAQESDLEIPLQAGDASRYDTVVVEIRSSAADADPAAVYRVALPAGADHVTVRHPEALHGTFHVTVKFLKAGAVMAAYDWDVSGGKVGDAVATIPPPDTVIIDTSHHAKDTVPPAAPHVSAKTQADPSRPLWTWHTGGGGGAGIYRYRLDDSDLSASQAKPDTSWRPESGIAQGRHVLYVQERDSAGNWSVRGSGAVQVALDLPQAPSVKAAAALTNDSRPTWSWSGSGAGTFRYKLDDSALAAGGVETQATSFRPSAPLAEGRHTLYVQERGAGGNWSPAASDSVVVDLTPPMAPKVAAPASPVEGGEGSFTWAPQGGGDGSFRYRLDGGSWIETRNLQVTLPAAPGAHLCEAEEKDAAGNWSPAGSDSAAVTPKLLPKAVYRIDGTVKDSLGKQGNLNLVNADLQGDGAYLNGVYDGSTGPETDTIKGFDPSDFAVEIEFNADEVPAHPEPLLVAGEGYRWLGYWLDSTGIVMLEMNYSTVEKRTTQKFAPKTWHKAKIAYDGTKGTIYYDGVSLGSQAAVLQHHGEFQFMLTDYGWGKTFKGHFRNLKVWKGTSLLADYPLIGDGTDLTGRNKDAWTYQASFGKTDGVACGGAVGANGNQVVTPSLADVDFQEFSIAARLRFAALPAAGMPLLVGGTSIPWLSARLEKDGTVSLVVKGSGIARSSAVFAANAEHSVRILYSAASGRAWLFMDGSPAASAAVPSLNASGSPQLGITDNPSGDAFKGTLLEIRVLSR